MLGLLRPDVAAAYGVDELELYVASLDLDRLAAVAKPTVVFRDLVTYPPAEQDLAVVVDGGVPAADVVATARKAGGKLVAEVRVFDVYEGDQVPEGKRSLALRVLMRSVRAHAERQGHRHGAKQDRRRAREGVRRDASLGAATGGGPCGPPPPLVADRRALVNRCMLVTTCSVTLALSAALR